ncbi:MAG: HD domain-containing protein [Flavobacteriales bacterium]|nr:HD domain-containing protein [Flavobacteriales bacterium]
MDVTAAEAYILGKLSRELPAGRTYHCYDHTLDVVRAAESIARQEHIGSEDMDLLRVAALFHDSGFTEQDHDHEEASCRIARKVLPDMGFSGDSVERICAMIMATKIPQTPMDALAGILCDADLDYLGRPDFHRIARTLFEEMKTYGVLSTEREWNELQVRFLERHGYFTRTNLRDRELLKQKHLAEVRKLLERP